MTEAQNRARPVREPTREELLAEVSALRRAVEEQREAFGLFRILAEESPSMIFLFDLAERRLRYVNRRFEETLGWTSADVTRPGFDFLSLVAPESVEAVLRSHETHLRGEDHLPFEYRMLARDGRRIEVFLISRVVEHRGGRAVLGVITDITSQHRMAEEVTAATAAAGIERSRAESVIAALGDSVIIQDRSWRILYQNEVSKGLFGDRRGELCHRVFEGRDDVCPWCPVVATFRDGRVHRTVVRNTRLPAGPRDFELVASPLLDDGGAVVAGLKLVRDVTEIMAAQEELRRAKAELERQNAELRALDRMRDSLVRDVSHELKTPVAKQAMQLEILRTVLGPECGRLAEPTLRVMEEAVHRQQRVIRNLLDLARLESGRQVFRLAPVRLDEVVRRVLEDGRPAVEAAGVSVACAVDPVEVLADSELLWHAIANLVGNGVKFARPAGERRLAITGGREGAGAVLRIADNGIGLAPEELERVFQRFYRADASIEGSGVGLCLCRSLVEGMGGTVALESAGRGRGATATLRLRLASEAR